MDNINNERKPTAVDGGWRNNRVVVRRKSTEVDEGWRTATSSNGRKATEVDEGWRTATSSNGRKATEVDEGWRTATSSSGRKATEVDEGWRKITDDILNPENVMQETKNHFPTIDAFKKEIVKLSQLTSSKNEIYSVKNTVSEEGGESVILLCSDPNGNDVVAKVYYEPANGKGTSIATRKHILEYMSTEEGKKYTLAVSDIGIVEFGESKYYFEIMPYCPNTDLSDDGAYSFDDIVRITRQVNEALHSIHKSGIVHRDIKPENLYDLDGSIKLGDFGIARNGAAGRSKATEWIAGTEGYAAPETRRYIFSEKSDYYSLGVTLATLFEGHFVFDNMTFEMQSLAQESEKLPLTRADKNREQLENLFNGLCRINSKQRFGYEDVNRWLADHNYVGGFAEEEWPKAFRMLGEEYRDEKSLFFGITKDEAHWTEGKNMLFSKFFENFFMSFRTDLARAAQVADELYRGDNSDKGLAIFLKNLYPEGPIVWKGYTFNGLQELGEKMVVAKFPEAFGEVLQNNCVSYWLTHTKGITADNDTQSLIEDIEKLSIREPEVSCYWFGNSFAKEKKLQICGKTVSDLNQLIEAMFISSKSFYFTDGYKKLIDKKNGADLYGFLYSFGYKEFIEKEWFEIEKCDMFNKTSLLFSMLDDISLKAQINPALLRRFFINYGPLGIVTYTKKLLHSENQVYSALDADGKHIISKIMNFREPSEGRIGETFRAYSPLIDDLEKFIRVLADNPHCVVTGVYETHGVICTNLKGCFAFEIFGKMAPLGFCALLEEKEGVLK